VASDYLFAKRERSRVLIVAHRAEILVQAERTLRRALDDKWPETTVTWYLGADSNLGGDLIVASVQNSLGPKVWKN
jgi:superfamily II DNA or RNA helicase